MNNPQLTQAQVQTIIVGIISMNTELRPSDAVKAAIEIVKSLNETNCLITKPQQ